MQLWKGRFKKELSKTTNDFNSSISFDSRMYKEDIEGSIAHATMLGRCGIIKEEEANDIIKGLKGILADIENGTLHIDTEAEDIHTFIEGELTKRIGDNGKRLHTSRSRNDQVAVGNLNSLNLMTLFQQDHQLCRRKRTPILQSLFVVRAAEFSVTI